MWTEDDVESKKSTNPRGTRRLLVMAYLLSISLKIMSTHYTACPDLLHRDERGLDVGVSLGLVSGKLYFQ